MIDEVEIAELVRLWHSDKTLSEAAVELHLTSNRLQWHWRRLRTLGELPDHPRHSTTPRTPMNDRPHDGRPTLVFEDPLLDKLFEHHPDKAPKKF